MKNSIIALIVIFLLWLFFGKDKTTKTVKAPPLVGAQGQTTPGGAIPTSGGGTVVKTPATAAVITPTAKVPEIITAYPENYQVNPATTYTPPAEIAAAIQEKKTEILANPYRPEALAAEAELQRVEVERQAANEALRMIEQKIAQAEKEKRAIDAETLAAQQAAAAKAKAENEAKAIDIAYKAANSNQLMQFDAGNSEELERLNAFLAVKDQIANAALSDVEKRLFLRQVSNIETQYRLASTAKSNGDQAGFERHIGLAQDMEATLKFSIASKERLYLSMQAIEVAKIITAQPDFVPTPLVVEPKPFVAVPVIVEPAPVQAPPPAYVAPVITAQAPPDSYIEPIEDTTMISPGSKFIGSEDYALNPTPLYSDAAGVPTDSGDGFNLGRRSSFLVEM